MAERFALKSGTLKFGNVVYDAASITLLPPETREAVDVTATSDTTHQYIKGALKNYDEITLTLYMKPSGNLTTDAAPAAFEVEGVLEDGITTPDPPISLNFNRAIITKVSPPYLEATSDRKAVYDVTFQPDGSVAAQSNGAAQSTQSNGAAQSTQSNGAAQSTQSNG